MGNQAGHMLLARMGKRRLRPGGKKGTEWLLGKGQFGENTQVLEVACNMGTSAIEMARRFGCHIIGVDIDHKALDKAKENIAKAGLAEWIEVQFANATNLPFGDNTFDVVLNEAMLTMLPEHQKEQAVKEYLRVLKPGGVLLTHDVLLPDNTPQSVLKELQEAIHVPATPLTEKGWEQLFLQAGFSGVETLTGKMTLLSPRGLVYDEGLGRALRIFCNALKKENRKEFFRMFRTFNNRHNRFKFIAACNRK